MMECVPTKGNKMPDGSGPSDPPIELEAEMDCGRAGTEVISNRQGAAPFFGCDRTFHRAQQR